MGASTFGAKAPPTPNETMAYRSLKYYVSYFQEYFHSLIRFDQNFLVGQMHQYKRIVMSVTGDRMNLDRAFAVREYIFSPVKLTKCAGLSDLVPVLIGKAWRWKRPLNNSPQIKIRSSIGHTD